MDQLIAALLDLLHELRGRDIPVTVGGGFGLYLKRQQLERVGQRTLFYGLPEPRSTNDLDLFLRTEVLVDIDRTRHFADAIRRLGYTAVNAAKFLQWERNIITAGTSQRVKIDVLVGPLGNAKAKLNVKMPRVRPKGNIEFHAHAVEEALHIEDLAMTIPVAGNRSNGESCASQVLVPHAFPYLMMKLYAFDDREEKGERDKERQHALDLYAIVGMMSEEEYERSKQLAADYVANKYVDRARAIVRDHFASRTAVGVLRLQEHQLYRADFQLDDFISVLGEVLP